MVCGQWWQSCCSVELLEGDKMDASLYDVEKLQPMCGAILDEKATVAVKMRTLFGLAAVGRVGSGASKDAVDLSLKTMALAMQKSDSALVRHEAAYVLGQTENPLAIGYLEETLATMDEDPMVRHEAAEALGAIASPECLKVLQRYRNDETTVVRETVEIAVERINRIEADPKAQEKHVIYKSVDPALASKSEDSMENAREALLDAELPLYDRYTAMFRLRNIALDDVRAVNALCEAFCDKSALFRHELAYVLGQIQSPASVGALSKVLLNKNEEAMVRHEAAEALGSIGNTECEQILEKFLHDEAPVVRESCEVALDITEYNVSDNLNYATTLTETN